MMNKNIVKVLVIIAKITRVMLEICAIYLAHTCNTDLMLTALKVVVILEFLIELYQVIK